MSQNADVAPDIKEARELAFKSSPVASIANWRSTVLLVQGEDDSNVPLQQTTDLVEKLRAQNVAFEELIFPDEIHYLIRMSDFIRTTAFTANSSTADSLHQTNGNIAKLLMFVLSEVFGLETVSGKSLGKRIRNDTVYSAKTIARCFLSDRH